MEYLKQNEPPVREARIRACSCFGGNCAEMASGQGRGCNQVAHRKFSQTQLCQSDFSLPMVNEIKDSVIIKHAPIGCGTMNMYYHAPDGKSRYIRTVNTNLTEADVISGGEEKLVQAIRFAATEFQPQNIFILSSCVPTLMGDDLDAVVTQLQKEVSPTLIPVYCAGFKTKISASGYDAVYHALLRYKIKEPAKARPLTEKGRRTVNLLNTVSVSDTDSKELIRLLNLLGLEVRPIVYGAAEQDFSEMLDAALNVCICATHDDYLVNYLQELYGMPFIIRNIPIGAVNTGKWLMTIAKHFGLAEKAAAIIAKEEADLAAAIAPFREKFAGKTAYVNGGEVRVLATAAMLESLNIRVLGIEARHHDGFAQELIETYPGNQSKTAYSAGQAYEKANFINALKPDLYVGHNGQCAWPAKQGVAVYTLFMKPYNYFGYTGVYQFARAVDRVLSNTSLYQNLKEHTQLPYQPSWYQQDPFSMIVEE